jgi:hydrophobe/amphiphile efflux-1 (HAE1) family protein
MIFSSPFIARPVATIMLMVAVVLLGIAGYMQLPVAALPTVDTPTIQVTAGLPGADPQTMASSVVTPLERQFGEIAGLQQMTSNAGAGTMQITLQFALGRSIDGAALDVQTAINAAAGQLPKTLPAPPTYRKINPADVPVLLIAMMSNTLPLTKVSDYANSIVAQKISQMPGVSLVTIGGEQNPAIRIQINPAQVSAAGLDFEQIRSALGLATADKPKGSFFGPHQSWLLTTNDQLFQTKDYDELILAYRNGAPIRLRDVGKAVVGPEDVTLHGWYNNRPAVVLAIQRQPGANVIATVDHIKAALPELRAALPPGVEMTIASDRTQTIRASVADVQFTLLLTIGLVVMVIFLFLRKAWATIIPAIAVPISLVGTFGVMFLLGYSLDNLSLMGLTIAVGFVVDDAIVMIENIMRHIEAGQPPLNAAMQGASEIGFTIISISISLIAVFIPLLLMSGVVGKMFQEFAVTVSVAIAVSALISLTLTPMLCAHLLPAHSKSEPGIISRGLERGFAALQGAYESGLKIAIRRRFATLMTMFATIALTGFLFVSIQKGFFPQQDTGLITGITEAAQDASPQDMAARQQAVINVIAQDPAVANATGYIGPGGPTVTENNGRLFILLKPRDQRDASADQVIQRLDLKLQSVQGIRAFMQATQDINLASRLSKTQYQYTLTDIDQQELSTWSQRLYERLRQTSELSDVATDQADGGRQLSVRIDRDAASRLGITPATVDETLYDAFGQRHVAQIFTALNNYYVILEVDPQFQQGPFALNRIYIRSASGGQVPLSEIAKIVPTTAPLSINHQGQFPSVTLSFNLSQGVSVGQALAAIQKVSADLHMPTTVATSFQGNAQAFQNSLKSTPMLILAALIAVYLILGVLYESAIHPITILSTLPSAAVGALLTLMLFGRPLDVIGLIGIILLIGIVKKNGIMLVDFARQAERDRGLASEESILEACRMRFRPILMTTLCALFAGVPLMLGTGNGSELRQPLGYAMVGGLLVSQILTLFTTPIIYIYLDRLSHWLVFATRRSNSALEAPSVTLQSS